VLHLEAGIARADLVRRDSVLAWGGNAITSCGAAATISFARVTFQTYSVPVSSVNTNVSADEEQAEQPGNVGRSAESWSMPAAVRSDSSSEARYRSRSSGVFSLSSIAE
jgi:hypothetical protein